MHHVNQIHNIQIVKNNRYDLRLGLLRVLREVPTQKQGVWPGCDQGASKWVGLTYKVNSVVLFVSSCPTTAMNQVKKHDKSTGARP